MIVIDTNDNVSGHLQLLKDKGVGCVGRYYSSSAWKRLTKPEAQAVSAAGLKLFTIFENSGDPELSVDSGTHDAQIATQQARTVGQPPGSAIYFALEHLPNGYTHADIPGVKDYLEGIRSAVQGQYKLGVYSDGVICDALLSAGLIDYAWLSASTSFEGTKTFYQSGRWALAQKAVDRDWSGISVDTDEAKADFGQFVVASAPIVTALRTSAAAAFAAQPAGVSGAALSSATQIPATGWVFFLQRLREELRAGEGFARTVGSYQVYQNGAPVSHLAGMTVERQGPGNNGAMGKTYHTCIEAGLYPIRPHDSAKYSTLHYLQTGAHPRPAVEIGNTGQRTEILIHPADRYGSTIGCINLSGPLADADSDIVLPDSIARVVAMINDLKQFHAGGLPTSADGSIKDAYLLVVDAPATA
jgi:hypothetical protein